MSRNWLIGGGIFLAALLVASIVVALLDSEETFPKGSAERAVQEYLKAVGDDDFEAAYGFLSAELMEECTIGEFAGGNVPMRSDLADDRITLEKTNTVGATVFVTVRVWQVRSSGPFGTSESSFEQRFSLGKQDEQWRFTEHPWPFLRCGPFKPEPARRPLVPGATPVPANATSTSRG